MAFWSKETADESVLRILGPVKRVRFKVNLKRLLLYICFLQEKLLKIYA